MIGVKSWQGSRSGRCGWITSFLRINGSTFGVLFSFERSCGALAQLGERLLCTQEVSGSIPLGSIESKDSKIVH